MKPMKVEARRVGGGSVETCGRNPQRAAARTEAEAATGLRTKAEPSELMEALCERGNLRLAYQRVVENKGAAGVDGITVAEFKNHLKRHCRRSRPGYWPGTTCPSR